MKKHIDRPCDFARWARTDSWSLDEAAFILSGREPPQRDSPLPYAVPHDYEKIERWLRDSIEDGTLAVEQDKSGDVWASPRAILAWGKREGFPIDETLDKLIDEATTIKPAPEKTLHEQRWPWGNHETELLRKLALATERFWKLYDPDDPTTAPTNEQVSQWLVQQGVASRVSEIMAQILRADSLPKGPRK